MAKAKRSEYIAVRKKFAVMILALLVAAAAVAAFIGNYNFHSERVSTASPDSLEAKFAALSGAHTSLCAGPGFIGEKSDADRLQGACCSAMDFHRYSEQVKDLEKYSDIALIHDNHITKHSIACFHCHTNMTHSVKTISKPAKLDCCG